MGWGSATGLFDAAVRLGVEPLTGRPKSKIAAH